MPNYERIAESIEAYQVKKDYIDDVAKWCGGQVIADVKPSDPTDIREFLRVPNVQHGYFDVAIDDYVIKDLASGRFRAMEEKDFEEVYTLQGPGDSGDPEYKSSGVDLNEVSEVGYFNPEKAQKSEISSGEFKGHVLGAPEGTWPNPTRMTADHPSIFGNNK